TTRATTPSTRCTSTSRTASRCRRASPTARAPTRPRPTSPRCARARTSSTPARAMPTTPASAVEAPPVIEARGVTKQYGALTALQGVDLRIASGEIVGLVGDNGAGKSTLIKILSGAIQPTSGELLVDGERLTMHSPLEARRKGIETVYQDL